MDYCSALKEISANATTWANLEDIMMIELSQSQEDTYYIFYLCEVAKAVKFIERGSIRWWFP